MLYKQFAEDLVKNYLLLVFCLAFGGFANEEYLLKKGAAIRAEQLPQKYEKLKPLYNKLSPIQPGDWLANHEEAGQSVKEYIRTRRIKPGAVKKFIYIQRIGTFSEKQKLVLDRCKDYMAICFGVEIKELAVLTEISIPHSGQRIHPAFGMKQFYTTYLLDDVLKKRKPVDALCVIGFTATDLYPHPDWNFVFGIARPRDGLGLWSIYRNGDPAESEEMYQLCLKRTIHTAIHEAGHLFSIKHCIAYDCVMNGSNSREESDRRELYFCPSCLYKLCGNLKIKPEKRFAELAQFCEDNKFPKQAEFFKKLIAAAVNKIK